MKRKNRERTQSLFAFRWPTLLLSLVLGTLFGSIVMLVALDRPATLTKVSSLKNEAFIRTSKPEAKLTASTFSRSSAVPAAAPSQAECPSSRFSQAETPVVSASRDLTEQEKIEQENESIAAANERAQEIAQSIAASASQDGAEVHLYQRK